jgi:hypothetical protein
LARKEYFESICDNIMEFQIIGHYMKMKELGLKNCGFQHIGTEGPKGNITVYQRKVLKILGNYITELYN